MWSTPIRPAPCWPLVAGRLEIHLPDQRPSVGLRVEEIEQAAAEPAHGGDVELARADAPGETACRAAPSRARPSPPRHRRAAPMAQTDGAVGDVEAVGEAVLVAVDDDVDVALAPQRDSLDRCRPAGRNPRARSSVSKLAPVGSRRPRIR